MEGHPAASRVIGCAIEVHRQMGPGLLEAAYESCLAHELAAAGLQFRRQVPVPLIYKGTPIDCGFRLDLLVERDLIIEIKCVDAIKGQQTEALSGGVEFVLKNYRRVERRRTRAQDESLALKGQRGLF